MLWGLAYRRARKGLVVLLVGTHSVSSSLFGWLQKNVCVCVCVCVCVGEAFLSELTSAIAQREAFLPELTSVF